jgi:hypothetical protein
METKDKQVSSVSLKNKIYTISIVFGLTIIILIIFFVLPSLKEIKENSKDLLLGKNNLAFLEAQVNEIENFKKNYNDYQPNLEKIDQLFVDSKNPVDFIKFLEKTASDFEIESEISLLSLPQGKEQDTVIFQIFSKGDFSKILKFSEKLENGPYLIKIQNLTIKKSEKEKVSKEYSPGEVEAIFLIKAFVKP